MRAISQTARAGSREGPKERAIIRERKSRASRTTKRRGKGIRRWAGMGEQFHKENKNRWLHHDSNNHDAATGRRL
jgi:hypothetical protein